MPEAKKQFNIRRHFARSFRGWRLARRLPLKAVADDLGITKSALCQWESGLTFPSPEKLALIASYTGQPVCRFVCADSSQHCHQKRHGGV